MFARILSVFLQECNYKSCKKYLCLQEFYLNSCKNVIINLARNTYCLQNFAGIFARKSCKIKILARKILYLARNIKTCKSYLARMVQDFMNHLREKDHFDCKTCKSCKRVPRFERKSYCKTCIKLARRFLLGPCSL